MSRDLFRKANKEWNKIQREKKRMDKALKKVQVMMERANKLNK